MANLLSIKKQKSADGVHQHILNLFNAVSQPTIIESVLQSADPTVELADSRGFLSTNWVRIAVGVRAFTTHSPAVPDVLGSGRNAGALRQARRVGFPVIGAGAADDISRCTYYFCNAYGS